MILALLLTGALLSLAGSSPIAQVADLVLARGDVWIQDVTVISAERSVPVEHAHVVLRGDRVHSVATARPRGAATGVTVIDGSGMYVVPGLIDGHVHLTEIPGMTLDQQQAMPGVVEAYFRQLPRSYLYFGFTAVVDLIVTDRERLDRIRAAEVGPAIFNCGGALALANGYPMNYLPTTIREVLRDSGGVSVEQVPMAALRRIRERPRLATVYIAAQGGRVIFGSDTPSGLIYGNPPGYNGYLELREMEAAGLSPRPILTAATIENAQLLRLADYGTIEPGKIASLLVLRENPLLSTSAFDTIETVIVKGRTIPRATLAADTGR